jgi:5-methylcytosine-specific restriction endonuclease McrA
MCRRTRGSKIKFYKLGHKRCHYCCVQLNYASKFKNSATVEHIIPKSKGGTLGVSNVLIICATCNKKRGNKSFLAFVTGSQFPRQEWLKLKYYSALDYYAKIGKKLDLAKYEYEKDTE